MAESLPGRRASDDRRRLVGPQSGVRDQRVEIAMMRTPDGHGRIELSRFLAPPVVADHRKAPVNALGVPRWPGSVNEQLPR
jgi:hypothetical protein